MAAPSEASATTAVPRILPETAATKRRKRFRVDEDIALLKEVLVANPFEQPQRWDEVLANVEYLAARPLTIRAIRERLDLLIGYFRRNDRVNLRKSGTEEQYGEKERLLQDVSDLAREFSYAPRTMPRTQPRRGNATAQRKPTELLLAQQTRDAALPTVRVPPAVRQQIWKRPAAPFAQHTEAATVDAVSFVTRESAQPCDSQQIREYSSGVSDLLLDMCNSHDPSAPSPDEGEAPPASQEAVESGETEVTAGGTTPSADTAVPNSARQPPRKRPTTQSLPRGLRGLQTLGMMLLEKREVNEFTIKQRELDLQERRMAHDEERLALDERKLMLEEKKFHLEASSRAQEHKEIIQEVKKLFEEQGKRIEELVKENLSCFSKV
ncbi:uncharacterized protein LOC144180644 [Haemaphysalis longicornis]